MKRVLLLVLMMLFVKVSSQIVVSEDYETNTLGNGWTATTSNNNAIGVSYGTFGPAACKNQKTVYKNVDSTINSFYLVYTSTVSNGTSLDYSFTYLATSRTTGVISGTLSVDFSNDGGASWTVLQQTALPTAPGTSTSIPCTTVTGNIDGALIPSGTNFKFRIKVDQGTGGDFNIGFDDVNLKQVVTTVPTCTNITAPVSGATGVSSTPTITWSIAGGATNYKVNVGTTSGGTDIINGQDVGNVLSYQIPAGKLNYLTKYYVSVIPTNSFGAATGCSEISFTTATITCPILSYPSSNAVGVGQTPTFKWNAVSGATGYKLSIGTAAGLNDVLNMLDVGNVTTYTPSVTLTLGKKYFWSVNSYNETLNSSGCFERSFTVNSTVAPANDSCSGALEATIFPYSYDQTDGVGSTNNTGYVASCNSTPSFMNDGLWFKFTGNGSDIIVKVTTTTKWDPKLTIYSGICGNFTCVGNADSTGSVLGATETYTVPSTLGTTYYVNVANLSGSTDPMEGNFKIDITTTALSTSSAELEKISVYPNPFKDILNISKIGNVKSISISDISGRIIRTASPTPSINLSDLKAGMYIISLTMKDGTFKTFKTIKR